MHNHQCYIIAATYRSGSTLLSEILESTGLAGAPREYFHRLNMPPLACEDYLAFIRETIQHTATPNGVFGTKLLWHHLAYIRNQTQAFPEYHTPALNAFQTMARLFSTPKYLYITRRDKLAQAISLTRARQTGIFHRYDENPKQPLAHPFYDPETIEWYLHKSRLDDLAWCTYFEKFSVTPFTVEYEDFLQHTEETIHAILDFLQIPAPTQIKLPPPRLKKTSDGLNAEWRQRFLEYNATAMQK